MKHYFPIVTQREFFDDNQPTEWYDDVATYTGYAALGGVIAFLLAAFSIISEYYIEILLGFGMVTVGNGIIFAIGSVVGITYFVAWILEESGAIDHNYIDTTLNVVFREWIETLTAVEWIRIPVIYMEYLVTIFLGLDEFDPTDDRFR